MIPGTAALLLILQAGLLVAQTPVAKPVSSWSADRRFYVSSPTTELTRSILDRMTTWGTDFDAITGRKGWSGTIRVLLSKDGADSERYLSRKVTLTQIGLEFSLFGPVSAVGEDGELIEVVTELLCYELATRQLENAAGRRLPRIPFWLVDGVAQLLSPERHEDWMRVVQGVTNRRKVPKLATIQAWNQPSPSKLERAYQRAFHFILVKALTYSKQERAAFGNWITQLAESQEETPAYWTDLTAAERWWAETVRQSSTRTSPEPFLSREKTQVALQALLPTMILDTATGEKTLYPFDQLDRAPRKGSLFVELKRKAEGLQQLLARGDLIYRPVPAAYLEAVRCLLDEKRKGEFQRWNREALELARALERQQQSVKDYLNWYEVTGGTSRPEIDFADYFKTRRQLERVESRLGSAFRDASLRIEKQ